jgi:DNA-binding NarL/FixJ family response regulator
MLFEKCLLFLFAGTAPLLALLLVLLLGAAVYGFLLIKVELRLLAKRAATRAELESATRKWTGEFEELRARLSEAERERHSSLAGSSAEPESLNLNRRAQILGLHRKGKRVQEIASALHIPQGEVELMVKVHDLSRSASREIHSISLL